MMKVKIKMTMMTFSLTEPTSKENRHSGCDLKVEGPFGAWMTKH